MNAHTISICLICGRDTFTGKCVCLSECPECHRLTLETTDVNHARHVALGVAVCSPECHASRYDPKQTSIDYRVL